MEAIIDCDRDFSAEYPGANGPDRDDAAVLGDSRGKSRKTILDADGLEQVVKLLARSPMRPAES